MSTRRIVIGQIAGQTDMRVSRPGYWADLDDVNDRKKISFAASRESFGQVATAGMINAADTWINFDVAFGSVPTAIFGLRHGGDTTVGEVRHYTNQNQDIVDCTAFVLVIEAGRMMATAPAKKFQNFQSDDRFNYFCVR